MLIVVLILAWKVNVPPKKLFTQLGGSRAGSGMLSGNAPFSLLGQDMGQGVQGSYAGVINGPDPTKQILYPYSLKSPLPTYYGHSLPLKPATPGPFVDSPITPHHLNAKCSPDCCPSPYSCDHGCLCVDQLGLKHGEHDRLKSKVVI